MIQYIHIHTITLWCILFILIFSHIHCDDPPVIPSSSSSSSSSTSTYTLLPDIHRNLTLPLLGSWNGKLLSSLYPDTCRDSQAQIQFVFNGLADGRVEYIMAYSLDGNPIQYMRVQAGYIQWIYDNEQTITEQFIYLSTVDFRSIIDDSPIRNDPMIDFTQSPSEFYEDCYLFRFSGNTSSINNEYKHENLTMTQRYYSADNRIFDPNNHTLDKNDYPINFPQACIRAKFNFIIGEKHMNCPNVLSDSILPNNSQDIKDADIYGYGDFRFELHRSDKDLLDVETSDHMLSPEPDYIGPIIAIILLVLLSICVCVLHKRVQERLSQANPYEIVELNSRSNSPNISKNGTPSSSSSHRTSQLELTHIGSRHKVSHIDYHNNNNNNNNSNVNNNKQKITKNQREKEIQRIRDEQSEFTLQIDDNDDEVELKLSDNEGEE